MYVLVDKNHDVVTSWEGMTLYVKTYLNLTAAKAASEKIPGSTPVPIVNDNGEMLELLNMQAVPGNDGELIAKLTAETVTCVLCGERTSRQSAHLHQDGWIGDECCWDERLRASE